MKNSIISDDIIYFAQTSGTTNHPKYLPQTSHYIKELRRTWEIWMNELFETRPSTFSPFGSILNITSKPYEGKTQGEIYYGSVSGMIHKLQPKYIHLLYAVPDEVFYIKDFRLRYYLIILFSLRKNLTFIVSPNPTTLIIYANKLNSYIYNFINDLQNNTIEFLDKSKNIDLNLKNKLLKEFKKNPNNNYKIAKKLKQLVYDKKKIYPKDVFQNLKTIGTWTGGNVGFYANQLNRYFGEDIIIRELGYMASEGRFSIPLHNSPEGCGVLEIALNFYEFIEVEKYKKGVRKTKLSHELKEGKKYFILITNENGLYRYFIDDIVEVCGFEKSTPIIKFLQKGKYFSSITGEKLTEWEIIDALNETKEKLLIDVHTFFAAANISYSKPFYQYFIEFEKDIGIEKQKELEKDLDKKLKELNIEYKSKRDSLRLNPVKIEKLPKNMIIELKKEFSKNSSTDSQTKVPKLIVLEKDRKILEERGFL